MWSVNQGKCRTDRFWDTRRQKKFRQVSDPADTCPAAVVTIAETRRQSAGLMYRRHPFHEYTGQLPTRAPVIIQNLVADWVQLNRCPTAGSTVATWAHQIPPFARLTTVGGIVDTLADADATTGDHILAELVGRYQGGDQLAGRVTLQAMLPALNRLARRARMPADIDTIEARSHHTISTFWLVLATTRATRCLASRLQLDTLHALTQHQRQKTNTWEHYTDHTSTGTADIAAADIAAAEPHRDPADIDLDDLLAWARSHQVLTHADVQLVADVYLTDPRQASYQAAATAAGITEAACRKRIQRARHRLTAAVTDNANEPLPHHTSVA